MFQAEGRSDAFDPPMKVRSRIPAWSSLDASYCLRNVTPLLNTHSFRRKFLAAVGALPQIVHVEFSITQIYGSRCYARCLTSSFSPLHPSKVWKHGVLPEVGVSRSQTLRGHPQLK